MYVYIYIYIYIYLFIYTHTQAYPGGTKRATSVNTPLLRLQSSEARKIKTTKNVCVCRAPRPEKTIFRRPAMSKNIELVRRSFRRRGSCTLAEAGRLVHSSLVCLLLLLFGAVMQGSDQIY